MSRNFLIALAIFASTGAVGLFAAGQGTTTGRVATGAIANSPATFHDWGEVQIGGGTLRAEFEIENTGTGLLLLRDITTSCMCTTARLRLGDVVSPAFGMHTKSDFAASVSPGEKAFLEIEFDPSYHGMSGLGSVQRQVLLGTNEPSQETLNFLLTAFVRN